MGGLRDYMGTSHPRRDLSKHLSKSSSEINSLCSTAKLQVILRIGKSINQEMMHKACCLIVDARCLRHDACANTSPLLADNYSIVVQLLSRAMSLSEVIPSGMLRGMSRKDLVKNKLPVEFEDEVLHILEQVGAMANPRFYATHVLGVTPKALAAFLRTTRAREAAARATPDSRKAFRRYVRNVPSAPSPGQVVDISQVENLTIIEEEMPREIVSAFRLIKDQDQHD